MDLLYALSSAAEKRLLPLLRQILVFFLFLLQRYPLLEEAIRS
jgi:hypothetical protein